MPRRPKTIPGPSRLSGLLKQLTRAPRLVLSEDVTRLKLTYRFKGGDLAARYFVKEDLPRIRYANPALTIDVDKLSPSNPAQRGQPSSLVLEFANAPPLTIPLKHTWSTAILTDLMSAAGSSAWAEWVKTRAAKGEPLHPPPEPRPESSGAKKTTAPGPARMPWRLKSPRAAAAKAAAVAGKGGAATSGGAGAATGASDKKQGKGKDAGIKELLGLRGDVPGTGGASASL